MSRQTVELRHGTALAVVCPEVGGSLLRFAWETPSGMLDWLRPLPPGAEQAGDPLALAGFPLAPYSNRIREGRFSFAGREIILPANWSQPHTIHGHGWQAPWQVEARGDDNLLLAYDHPADAWPFGYRATQRFRLTPEALDITLTLTNTGSGSMPAGLGFHPYFFRTPHTILRAAVAGMWEADGEVMPVRHVQPRRTMDPNAGVHVDTTTLDHVFTGWERRAVIHWPERGYRLVLTASGELGFLVVFTPSGEDFFCVEPVSHCTDAFNLAAGGEPDTGMRVLDSGQSMSAAITLRPEPDDAALTGEEPPL